MWPEWLDYFVCISAVIIGGIQVISPTDCQKNHPETWKRVWIIITLGLCFLIGLQKYLAYKDHAKELQASRDAIGGVNKKLDEIKGDFFSVAQAAKVPITESTKGMADAIIAKIEMQAAVNGHDNTASQNKNGNAGTNNGIQAQTVNGGIHFAPPVAKLADERDWDALYQLGEIVATTQTPSFNDPHHTVTFQQMDVTTKADTSKTFEYRKWVINCDMNGQHLPDDSLPPGVMASVVMPKSVYGWTCTKVGLRK